MTGTVRMSFLAKTIAEAKEKAVEEWRKIIGDDYAELPWDTDITLSSDQLGLEPMVTALVTIELDEISTYLVAAES